MELLKLSFIVGVLAALNFACASKYKAEKIETKIDNPAHVTGDTAVGVKDGNAVVQKKVLMSEELRTLQYEVYESEDKVYGTRKYGSAGLYGVLRDCRAQLADPKNGGDGKLKWTEAQDRVSDKEDEFKIGLDEKDKLVGVSEEFLSDRIARFRDYKKLLQKRQDEYEDKVAICKAELKAQKATVSKSE